MANTTGTWYSGGYEASRVLADIGREIYLINPSQNPFTRFMAELPTEDTIDEQFTWWEDDFSPWTDTTASAADPGDTSILVTNPDRYMVNHVFRVVSGSGFGEQILVTSMDVANSLAYVTRAFGETASASITNGSTLMLLGTAALEGDTAKDGLITPKTQNFNNIQEFRTPYAMSNRSRMRNVLTGDPWTFESMKAGMEHAMSIERQFMFGERKLATASNQTRSTTRGMLKWISTYSTNVGGVMAQSDWEDIIGDPFKLGVSSDTKVCMANLKLLKVLNGYASGKAQLQQVGGEVVMGLRVTRYQTTTGKQIVLVHHKLLDDLESTMNGVGVIVDFKHVKKRVWTNNGKSGDTKEVEIILANGETAQKREYQTPGIGLEVQFEKTHALVYGVTG